MGSKEKPLTEELIKRLHALVEVGPRTRPTPYRDGQNAIKNSSTGTLIYLLPEAKDVPALIASLVAWAAEAERFGLTVHPHHNCYFGRSEAELTPWLEYFISTLAAVFESVRLTAQKCAVQEPEELRRPPGGSRAG